MRKILWKLVILTLMGGAYGCGGRPTFTPVEWIKVKPGTFEMGSPSSENCRESGNFKETLHRVTLTYGFEISKTETTQGQYEDELGVNPSHFVECGPDCPVEKVSWNEAAAYCNILSKAGKHKPCYDCVGGACDVAAAYSGKKIYTCPGYRLPTEAEWEYAARAGTTTALYSGAINSCKGYDDNASAIAWFQGNSGSTLHLAGLKKANKWGIHDMSGSVWEWVHDWFEDDLGSGPQTNPSGPMQETLGRVLRGGSCMVEPQFVRSASRYNYAAPSTQIKLHGFRCVRTAK